MSEEKGIAVAGKEDAMSGGHHHHHYYYFYPADAVPPGARPQLQPQPPAPPVPQHWSGGRPAPTGGSGQPDPGQPHHHPHNHLGESTLVRGLLVGAAVGFVLTNDTVQKALIRSAVRLWTVAQGSVEEVKERFRDAEAEIKAAAEKS